jgi:2-dehydro-3-deoxygalactonokinase
MTADWIAVDWGTSNLRAWAMARDGAVLATGESADGMGTLTPERYEPALLRIIGGWLDGLPGDRRLPVVICGMAGARQGWVEAPYAPAPCAAVPANPARPAVADARIDVMILPGVKQAQPPDVIRGEETQVAGLLARHPGFEGVALLPGTHSKWVHVQADEIVSFATFMTGEMFALLSRQSVLRHTVLGTGADDGAFVAAVDAALTDPARAWARLFGLRAEALIANLSADTARARLSGTLIGLELAGARAWWLGMRVALVGSGELGRLYALALGHVGITPERCDTTDLTLAGLTRAHAALAKDTCR